MRNPADFSTVDSENQNSVIVKIKNQECRKSKPNYTDYSNTYPFLSVGVSAYMVYMARVRMRTDQNIY